VCQKEGVLKLEEHCHETAAPQASAFGSERRRALGSVTHLIGFRLSDTAGTLDRRLLRWRP
jgi:hypothetical protein